MSSNPHKPHPDAVLVALPTGEVVPFPEGRPRDVAEDIMDARRAGYSIAVPVVKTADGVVRFITVEGQHGGVAALEKVLRPTRQHNGKQVPVAMLSSEWGRLGASARAEHLLTAAPVDPKDQEIARLSALLAEKSGGKPVAK